MAYSPAPLDLDTVLSPQWLSETLGVPVASTSIAEELVTIASKVRFRVEYAGDRGDLPDAFCVKGYFAEQSRAFASLGQIETHFYGELAPRLGVRVPRCVHTGVDPDTGHGLIVMADLVAEGARFLTALSPYSVDAAAQTLEQLATLHSFDPDAGVVGDAAWLAPRLSGYLDYVDEARLQSQLDDGRASALSESTRDARRLRQALAVLAERTSTAPRHVIHGDAHAGNLYLDADGRPGLIDWQVVQLGAWELDVAYHLVAVLDVDDRRNNEQALVSHYLDERRARGVDTPTHAEAWDAYRDALAYGYYMWAITQRVERPVIETFVHRLGAAVEEHETFSRLGV